MRTAAALGRMAGRVLLAGGALMLAGGGAAAAACSGRIVSSPNPELAYNPFDAAGRTQEFHLRAENAGSETCALVLKFVRLDGLPATAGALDFTVSGKDGGVLIAAAPSPAASGQIISRPLAPGETYDFSYLVTVAAGQMLPPGSYSQPAELQLQAAASPADLASAPVQTAGLTLSVAVAQQLSVNIAGGGTATTVDFGALVQGAAKTVLIQTRSNVRFSLKVSSANGGALAMAEPYTQWRIPYRMELDGRPSPPQAIIGPFVATVLTGNSVAASFTIGDAGGKRAGLYRDTVTIEIVPAL